MSTNECFYALLGVSRTASAEEIKKAYRIAARNTHPDRCGAASTERFQAVQQAYEVLNDAKLRTIYDRLGRDAAVKAASQNNAGSGGGADDSVFGDVEEMLRNMFGGGESPFPGASRPFFTPFGGAGGGIFFHNMAQEPEPRQIVQQITLEDIFEARRIQITIPVPPNAMNQHADGAEQSAQQIAIECASLDGFSGFKGERRVVLQDRYGNVLLRLQLAPHDEWEPAGNLRLQKRVSLSLADALLGTKIQFSLPNTEKSVVEHHLESVVDPHATHLHRHGKWQLLLRFDVQFPKSVPKDETVRSALRSALQNLK